MAAKVRQRHEVGFLPVFHNGLLLPSSSELVGSEKGVVEGRGFSYQEVGSESGFETGHIPGLNVINLASASK